VIANEKILVTGPAGQIAFPICEHLAANNEVWGIARFTQPGSRERVEALGVTTRVIDLGGDELSDLPDDFTYVLHLAAYLAPGRYYDAALRVDAEGTGMLLYHCRRAKAALVMSTSGVYEPHDDPWHLYRESDPLGDVHLPAVPTYSIAKNGQEAVARACARAFGLPVVIARMNAAYGPNGGLPAFHLDAIVAGTPIPVRHDPNPFSPIYEQDINEQLEPLLAAAAVPATIINWAGDEVVSVQQWSAHLGELAGRQPSFALNPAPGTQIGVANDVAVRRALTGPCRFSWRTGMKAMFDSRYPGGVDCDTRPKGGGAHAMERSQKPAQ
jgi:nucleoside-diphosphate-sugar epimerase